MTNDNYRNPMQKAAISTVAIIGICSTVFAQDECLTATFVVDGNNGPFSNSSMTTSAPAWLCGLGGNDMWFAYVALGNGTLTVDTCGGGFDTTLEIFDGTNGCGGASLGCNDDACFLQSILNIPCTTGTPYFIRVGGFNGQTGSFPLNVSGPLGTGSVATAQFYGTGCYDSASSFYELFTQAGAFDLANSSMTMLNTGSGYTVLPIFMPWISPGPGAIALALGDDDEVSQALSIPFPMLFGPISALQVCSNGFVSANFGNGTSFSPDSNVMLGNPEAAFYSWHDFDPSAAGSGQIKFEEVGSIAVFTWDGVFDFGPPSTGNASTWQIQFDCSNGNVTFLWQTMSTLFSFPGGDNLVGYSPGGPSLDPGSRDISATLANSFSLPALDTRALALGLSARPRLGTVINFISSNVPRGTLLGVTMLSFAQINPGVDLGLIGAPGCLQYLLPAVSLVSVITTQGGFSQPLTIPSGASFVGLNLFGQSASLSNGVNNLGILTSNGLALHLGVL